MKLKVLSVFQDKYTFQLYKVGDVIKVEDEVRIADLEERKLAEVIKEKMDVKCISLFDKEFDKKVVVEALKSIGVQVTMNMKEESIFSKVAGLDEEIISSLKEALEIENV